MSQDPLQKLWQSQQLDIPVEQIMKQAKAKQRRMFWFMTSDILAWLIVVVASAWNIYRKGTPEGFALGLFTIIFVSLIVGYVLWLRTSTWGIDALDVRNTLKLSIRRCEAGIQLGWVSNASCIIVVLALLLFNYFFPEYLADRLTFAFGWAFGWCVLFFIGYHWYSKRQRQKMHHYQALLKQLEQNEEPHQ